MAELVHHTTAANFAAIESAGFIEPRDPRPDTGELVLYVSGHQPTFVLRLRLRRHCRRWERQGYRVVRTFQGTTPELFDRDVVRSYDAERPDALTVGAVLVRPGSTTPVAGRSTQQDSASGGDRCCGMTEDEFDEFVRNAVGHTGAYARWRVAGIPIRWLQAERGHGASRCPRRACEVG